jgi:hypothetical protein
VGWLTSSDAIPLLAEWADKILTLDVVADRAVPSEHADKIIPFHIGPDRWCNPFNQELLSILKRMIVEKLAVPS